MRLFSILLIILVSFSFLNAQFGVKAGLNMANIHTEPDSEGLEYLYRFQGALIYDLENLEKFTTRFLGAFSQKGFKQEYSWGDKDLRLNNLDLGVQLLYVIMAKQNIKFQGFFGPQLGIGINANTEYSGDKVELEYGKDLTRFDFGFNTGFIMDFGKPFICVDLNFGLTNMKKDDVDDRELTHRVLSIVGGYKFNK